MEKQVDIFSHSKLHDYELCSVSIDYVNKQIHIHVISPQGDLREIAVDGVISVQMSLTENWGKGKYIASTDIVQRNEYTTIEVTLNSGDELTIQITR